MLGPWRPRADKGYFTVTQTSFRSGCQVMTLSASIELMQLALCLSIALGSQQSTPCQHYSCPDLCRLLRILPL